MYESKAKMRYEFYIFQTTFLLLGGLLCAIIGLIGSLLESVFWFFSANFMIIPALLVIPVFALFGRLIPSILYGQSAKQSAVERLREAET